MTHRPASLTAEGTRTLPLLTDTNPASFLQDPPTSGNRWSHGLYPSSSVWRRAVSSLPPPGQVELSPCGCGMCRGPTPHIMTCRRRCRARWSEREKLRSQSEQRNGLIPVCLRKCRVSSSERANFHVHPSHVQWYGFSPETQHRELC